MYDTQWVVSTDFDGNGITLGRERSTERKACEGTNEQTAKRVERPRQAFVLWPVPLYACYTHAKLLSNVLELDERSVLQGREREERKRLFARAGVTKGSEGARRAFRPHRENGKRDQRLPKRKFSVSTSLVTGAVTSD